VFLSTHSNEALISCDTLPGQRGINTDHLPILTELKLEVASRLTEAIQNFRAVNWEDFKLELQKQLDKTPKPTCITNQVQLDARCKELTDALQEAIRTEVPTDEPTSKSKRWWTKELSLLRVHANKLGRMAYKLRGIPDHRIHKDHKIAKKKYQNTIKVTK